MKKIFLAMFLVINLQTQSMQTCEIQCPALGEIPTIEHAIQECAWNVAQLVKSPMQALRIKNQQDIFICCIIHENAHIPWKIKLLASENKNLKEPQGIYSDSEDISSKTVSSKDDLQKIYDYLFIKYTVPLERLRKHWVFTKNPSHDYWTATKKYGFLNYEYLLIDTLLKKYHLLDDERVTLNLHDADGKQSFNLKINDRYKSTFDHVFNFENTPNCLQLTIL